MDRSNSMNVIAKGAIILLFGSVLGKVFSLLYRIILSRFGEQAYGEFSLGLALFGILSVISVLGLDTGILRYLSVYSAEKNPAKIKGTVLFSIKTILLVSTILGFLLFILSDYISVTFFKTPSLSILLKIFAICLPFESLRTIFTHSFKAFKKIEYEVISRILIENFIKIVLTTIFIYFGLGIVSAAIAYLISLVISFIVSIYLLEKKFNTFTNSLAPIYNNKEIFYYSIPLVFNSLTLILITWIDTVMLGIFMTTAIVGIYNVAVPTGRLLLLFPKAFEALYLPHLASVQNNNDEFKKVYYTTTKWSIIFTSMSLFWLIFYAREVVLFFFKEPYLPAVTPLIILLIGYYIQGVLYTSRNLLLLIKKTKTIFVSTVFACLLNIVLNLILIPGYGMAGSALASTISLTVLGIIPLIVSIKETKIIPFNLRTIPIILLSLISALITKYITNLIQINNLLIVIILSVISVALLNLLFLVIFKLLEKEDKDIVYLIGKKLSSLIWLK